MILIVSAVAIGFLAENLRRSIHQLRQNERSLADSEMTLRVLISSGYNSQEITGRFAGKSIAGFILKPYQMAALTSRVQQIVNLA